MDKTEDVNTPGGTSTSVLGNPPSKEADPKDSGEGQLLHSNQIINEMVTPIKRNSNLIRSSMFSRSSSLMDLNSTIVQQQEAKNYQQISANDYNKGLKNLEAENQALKSKILQIEQYISSMKIEITALKKENLELRKVNVGNEEQSTKTNDVVSAHVEYCTDEDEIERETDWILRKSKKNEKRNKRKADNSLEGLQPSMKKFEKPNQEKLEKKTEKNEKTKEGQANKEKLPPPINILGVNNHSEIQAIMKVVTDQDYKITAMNNDVWKVNTTNSVAYRNLTMKLNIDKYQWYTFENKNDRHIKVMARGLHPSCSVDDIVDELTHKGFKIINAVNIIKKEKDNSEEGAISYTRRGMPLFMLTFDHQQNVKDVYDIKGILNMRVKIEPVKKTSTKIPQCKKCQGYNHTQKYCAREAFCVKCSGKHFTSVCNLSRDAPAKCINCKGQHPANYRGCEVAKQLQKIRDNSNKNVYNKGSHNLKRKVLREEKENAKSNHDNIKMTYAQVTQQLNPQSNSESGYIKNSLETILKRLEEQTVLNQRLFNKIELLEGDKNKVKNTKK